MSAKSLPRAGEVERIGADPMAYLADWRARLGDLYALDMSGPLMSRDPECTGVIAVFGEAHHRAVLGDIERFVLPVSAARHFGLPKALVNLNASLHGMRGEAHAREKSMLARTLAAAEMGQARSAVAAAVDAVCATLPADGWPLLATMRELTLRAASVFLFGTAPVQGFESDALLAFFLQRRDATVPWATMDPQTRARLVDGGTMVDAGLRAYRRAVRAARGDIGDFGLFATLACDDALDEDRFVAHANVLFVSSNEPVAAGLTWTLLALSQLPGLRARLRAESADADDVDGRASLVPSLVDAVIAESLRVLTPNALMARVARVPVRLDGHRLPAGCEVVLCPFLAHRDATLFPQPQRFLPSRWHGLRPSPYAYFPFGAGGHVCVGRGLALRLLRDCLVALLRRGEVMLDADVDIDWRVHVVLLPTPDPRVRLCERDGTGGGVLRGGVRGIVELVDTES